MPRRSKPTAPSPRADDLLSGRGDPVVQPAGARQVPAMAAKASVMHQTSDIQWTSTEHSQDIHTELHKLRAAGVMKNPGPSWPASRISDLAIIHGISAP